MAFGSDAPGRGVPEIEMAHFGAGGDPALANVPAALIARSGDWQLRKNTLTGFLVSVNARTWDRWFIGQASGDANKDVARWRDFMAKSVGIKI